MEQDLRAGEQKEAGQPPAPAALTFIPMDDRHLSPTGHPEGHPPLERRNPDSLGESVTGTPAGFLHTESCGNHAGDQAAMEKLSIQKHSRICN